MKNLFLILILFATSNSLMAQMITPFDNKARKLYLNNEYDNALKSITKAIKKRPNNSDYYYDRVAINFVLENYDASLIDINKAICLTPSKYSYYLAKAQIEVRKQDFEAALKTIDVAIGLDSSIILAYTLRARFYFDLGKYDIALIEYQNAIDINNRYNPNINKGEMYYSHLFMGLCYMIQNDYNNSITEINKSIVDTNWQKVFLIDRARVYFLSNQIELANTDFQKVTKISIDTLQKAIAYAYLGDKEKAIETVNSFKRINQVNLFRTYNIQAASVYSILKEYDIALEYLNKIKHLKSYNTAWMINNPDFINLKNNERFLGIISEMKNN